MTANFDSTSLEDFLVQQGTPEGFTFGDTGENRFALSNDDEALWAMRSLAQAQRRIDEVKRQAQIELDRINRWVQLNTEQNSNTVEYFENLLKDYLVAVRENEADGRKSLDFPDGSIASRITQPKVAVEDAEAFLAWAEVNHPEWIRVKREADVSTIKKVVDFDGDAVVDPSTGDTIAGLSHTEGGISVTVKVAD